MTPNKRENPEHIFSEIIPVRVTKTKKIEIKDFCTNHDIDRSEFLRDAVFESIARYENMAYRIRTELCKYSTLIDIAENSGISIVTLTKFKEEGGVLKLRQMKVLEILLCHKEK